MFKLDLLIQRIDKFNKDRDLDQFHIPVNLAKSISIEANELLECYQWNYNANSEDVKEELKSEIEPIRYIGVSNHEYTDIENPFSIAMYAYECKLICGKLKLTEHTEKKWVSEKNLDKVIFATADLPIVDMALN